MFLDDLATELISLKQERAILNDSIARVESEIIIFVGEKEEGATTVKTDAFKVTTTGKRTYKVDADKLVSIKDRLPAGVIGKVISVQPKLNLKELKALDNETSLIFAEAITISPAKTAVTVKEL